jgi:hypothetical protein
MPVVDLDTYYHLMPTGWKASNLSEEFGALWTIKQHVYRRVDFSVTEFNTFSAGELKATTAQIEALLIEYPFPCTRVDLKVWLQ